MIDKKLAEIIDRFSQRLLTKKKLTPSECIALLTLSIIDNELENDKKEPGLSSDQR